MFPSHDHSGRGGRRRRNRQVPNPPSSLISYSGPIQTTSPSTATHTVGLHGRIIASVSGATNFFLAIENDPSIAQDWSNWASNYAEYRVLGIKVVFQPFNLKYQSTGGNVPLFGPVYVAEDHTNSGTTPVSITDVLAYGSAKCHNLMKTFVDELHMSGSEEAQFVGTSSPVTTASLLYAAGLGASVSNTFGEFFITFLVQFRNRR